MKCEYLNNGCELGYLTDYNTNLCLNDYSKCNNHLRLKNLHSFANPTGDLDREFMKMFDPTLLI